MVRETTMRSHMTHLDLFTHHSMARLTCIALLLVLTACGSTSTPKDTIIEIDLAADNAPIEPLDMDVRDELDQDLSKDLEDKAEMSTPDASDMNETDDSTPPSPPVWTWTGFEVLGHSTITRDVILEGVPITLGEPSPELLDPEGLSQAQAWAARRKAELDLFDLRVSQVRYGDGESYLLVEVVEQAESWRLTYREPPAERTTLESTELIDAYNAYMARQRALFDSGDYMKTTTVVVEDEHGLRITHPEDEELERLGLNLRQLAPQHSEQLLHLVAHARLDFERGRAADLLRWAGDFDESLSVAGSLLDDPSGLVRNNLGILLIHYTEHITMSHAQSKRLLDGLMLAVQRPDHGGRNKALYALDALMKRDPTLTTLLCSHAHVDLLERIAVQSVLYNVGPVARALTEPCMTP